MASAAESDTYAEIRPYEDAEVGAVLQRMSRDFLVLGGLLSLDHPRLPPLLALGLGWLLRRRLGRDLRRRLADVDSVESFQLFLRPIFVKNVVRRTTDALQHSGLENLDAAPRLFVANHRDILMDGGFLLLLLHDNGLPKPRLAVGDNLMSPRCVADLLRLNRAFIVHRRYAGREEAYRGRLHLSNYIRHSLLEDGVSVWIAQRAGRAKDGDDRTQPALIKMLAQAKDENESVGAYLNRLRLTPVSVSYEYDPCDAAKARELRMLKEAGAYRKRKGEDVRNIIRGVVGHKGRVHYGFGEPLSGDFDSIEAAAAELDRRIHSGCRLWPSNHIAAAELGWETPETNIDADQRKRFMERLNAMPAEDRPYALRLYANPVRNHMAAQS